MYMQYQFYQEFIDFVGGHGDQKLCVLFPRKCLENVMNTELQLIGNQAVHVEIWKLPNCRRYCVHKFNMFLIKEEELTGIASHISQSLRASSLHLLTSCRNGGRGGGGILNMGGGPGPHSLPQSISKSESIISHIQCNFCWGVFVDVICNYNSLRCN